MCMCIERVSRYHFETWQASQLVHCHDLTQVLKSWYSKAPKPTNF
mgnify:CR=1 FL=1